MFLTFCKNKDYFNKVKKHFNKIKMFFCFVIGFRLKIYDFFKDENLYENF